MNGEEVVGDQGVDEQHAEQGGNRQLNIEIAEVSD